MLSIHAATPVPQLLWKYAKKSVALRVRYFTTLPKGEASHTALVQDIPGIPFGTQVNRVESVAPKSVAKKARPAVLACACECGPKTSKSPLAEPSRDLTGSPPCCAAVRSDCSLCRVHRVTLARAATPAGGGRRPSRWPRRFMPAPQRQRTWLRRASTL